jgi:hypothetical protein
MTHHIHDRTPSETQFLRDHDQLKTDLAESQQQVMVLTDQVRELTGINSNLKFQNDFLIEQVERVTVDKAKFERVVVRVSAIADTIAATAQHQLADLREEIKLAAFIKVPGTVAAQPEGLEEGKKPLFLHPENEFVAYEVERARAWRDSDRSISDNHTGVATSELPPNRFGNGAVRT